MGLAETVVVHWTFGGLPIYRRLSETDGYADWFTETQVTVEDPVLGSEALYSDDSGHVERADFQLRGAFTTLEERNQVAARRGQVQTLANIVGARSRRARLQTITPQASDHGLYYLEMTFRAM